MRKDIPSSDRQREVSCNRVIDWIIKKNEIQDQ